MGADVIFCVFDVLYIVCCLMTLQHYAKISMFWESQAVLFSSLETPLGDGPSTIMPHVGDGNGNVNFSLCTLCAH